VAAVEVGGEDWQVAVADTADLRRQGLREVDDLGDVDGMLFEFDRETTAAFTMRDTLIPLDIAFFAIDGSLVDRLSMVPCTEEPCPTYRSSGPYRFAVETSAGGFDGIDPLTLDLPWFAVLESR
jgi:uncharacterized membrane protein (UPF0127 family)